MRLRIIYGSLAMAILIAMPIIGPLAQVVGGGFCIMLCAYELATALRQHDHSKPSLILAYLYIVISLASYYFVGLFGIIFTFAIFIMISLCRPIALENIHHSDVEASLFLLIYPCSLGLFFAMTGFLPGALAPLAILAIGIYASMVDILAFTVGMLFGKHKLIERISPKKTVEGAVGGFFGGLITAFLFYYAIQPIIGSNVMLTDFIIIGAMCGVAAQLGDLTASAIKRSMEIKDFSNLLPGHGGLLDRFDSMLFCAPIVFSYFYLIARIG